jgi:DNA invertase Pin-like site-specific DNA recombinase
MSTSYATLEDMSDPQTQLIGYARVSTTDQDPALQHDALRKLGCSRIFTETASGARTDRPELAAALDYLRPDDTLVVWKFDRLGRSIRHLIDTAADLKQRSIGFRSVQENIDTTSPGGKFVFHLFAALAELERDLMLERTYAGLAAARAQGRVGGRRPVLNSAQVTEVQRMHAAGRAVQEIADLFNVSRDTIYRRVEREA